MEIKDTLKDIVIMLIKILIACAALFFAGYYFVAVFQSVDFFGLIKSFIQFGMMVWLCGAVAKFM